MLALLREVAAVPVLTVSPTKISLLDADDTDYRTITLIYSTEGLPGLLQTIREWREVEDL
jgi:hypothetical protein